LKPERWDDPVIGGDRRGVRTRKAIRVTLILCAAGLVPLGAALYGSASRGLNPLTAWACTSEPKGGLGNVAGWDWEIEHNSCGILTKSEAVSVYASTHQEVGSGRSWFRKRTLVFRYAPAAVDDLLPSFEATGPDRILISVPSAQSVWVQNHLIGKTYVNYQIGRIDNPDPTGLGQAH
jgi:hypothetical protein